MVSGGDEFARTARRATCRLAIRTYSAQSREFDPSADLRSNLKADCVEFWGSNSV